MNTVYLNREILEVCHAVLNYKKFIISDNRVTKKVPMEKFDFDKMTEEYFYSLELPEGLRKNRMTYERIDRLGLVNKSELEKWNHCTNSELPQFVFIQYNLGMEETNMKVNGLYVSEWDDGIEIQSEAVIDLETKEVTIGKYLYDYDFDSMDLEILNREFIVIDGEEYPCCRLELPFHCEKGKENDIYWYE